MNTNLTFQFLFVAVPVLVGIFVLSFKRLYMGFKFFGVLPIYIFPGLCSSSVVFLLKVLICILDVPSLLYRYLNLPF